jgi:hypothetical protein
MSDEDIREAERTYRATGNQEDGERWVQAVIRTTGFPTIILITEIIKSRRALQAIAYSFSSSSSDHRVEGAHLKAMRKPVTPYDVVAFLRGEPEWMSGKHHQSETLPHVRLCIQPNCNEAATEQGFYPYPVFCKSHLSVLEELSRNILCGIAPSGSVVRCTLPAGHTGAHQ